MRVAERVPVRDPATTTHRPKQQDGLARMVTTQHYSCRLQHYMLVTSAQNPPTLSYTLCSCEAE